MIVEQNPLRREVFKIVWRVAAGGCIAAVLASDQSSDFQILLGLFLGLLAYVVHGLLQLTSIFRWIKDSSRYDMPESTGMWGYILDRLHRRHQKSDEAYQSLLGVLEKARQSTDAWSDAIIVLNCYGEIDWMNRSSKRLLGLRPHKDRGGVFLNLVRDPRLSAYMDKKIYDDPLEIPAPGNPNKFIQFRITSFGDNDSLILVRDVTRVRNLEQMRQDFVANVSHELKTPITVLMGFLESMQDVKDSFPDQWRKAIGSMHGQAERMKDLVDDLLLLSRLEDDVPTSPPVEIALVRLLSELCEEAQCLSEGHMIELEAVPDLTMRGVETEVRSALMNLIINAVNYTAGKNGVIVVKAQSTAEEILISVEDNGQGIEPSLIPRLTERFFRVDASRHRGDGGTGLGLAIVKHVMIRHNGQLDIESAPGHGSVFTCRFPVAKI